MSSTQVATPPSGAYVPLDPATRGKGYAHPDRLVSTEWLAANLGNPGLRILESNEDVLLYHTGHIPGAQAIDWTSDLNDRLVRDFVGAAEFQALLRRLDIDESSTVVLYGDANNWWATYAFWVFQLFGFRNAKILDGGRRAWEGEGRPLVDDHPSFASSTYVAPERHDLPFRAFRDEVLSHMVVRRKLIDVRTHEEFTGERTHMPEYPQEGVLRGGHIPGAKNVPWELAVNPNGTFKTAEELRELYEVEGNLRHGDDVITYCRIGERSSHTWFVLTYLLGFHRVRNYDGGWTEWGNGVRMPIER